MRKFIPVVCMILGLGVLSACEEVIDVDLNEANPELVIEGTLNAGTERAEVKLTRTRSFFAVEPAEPVDNATVTVDVDGTLFTLNPEGNGIYGAQIPVNPGQTTTLEINDGGQIHRAVSQVPVRVPIDSLVDEFFEPTSLFEGGWFVRCFLTDPGGMENFYRIKLEENGVPFNDPDDILVGNDLFIDGLSTNFALFYFFEEMDSITGRADSVTVELQSISRATFDYYDSLVDIVVNQGGGSVAAPANPVSNITGGGLGLWNVLQSDTSVIIVGP